MTAPRSPGSQRASGVSTAPSPISPTSPRQVLIRRGKSQFQEAFATHPQATNRGETPIRSISYFWRIFAVLQALRFGLWFARWELHLEAKRGIFFSPCPCYFLRSHTMLSPNDTALKETGNCEDPSGGLKQIHSVRFGREFKTAEQCSRRETRGCRGRLAVEKQRNRQLQEQQQPHKRWLLSAEAGTA